MTDTSVALIALDSYVLLQIHKHDKDYVLGILVLFNFPWRSVVCLSSTHSELLHRSV